MDRVGVGGAGPQAKALRRLEDQPLAARERELPRHRKADHPGSDHHDIDFVHRRASVAGAVAGGAYPRRAPSRRTMRRDVQPPTPWVAEESSMPAVSYRVEDSVAVLTIANPPVNALSLAVREGLVSGLEQAHGDTAGKAWVITGANGRLPPRADIPQGAPRSRPPSP